MWSHHCGGQTFTGVQSYSPLSNTYFLLAGNTFVNGSTFKVFTQDRLVYRSYTY